MLQEPTSVYLTYLTNSAGVSTMVYSSFVPFGIKIHALVFQAPNDSTLIFKITLLYFLEKN